MIHPSAEVFYPFWHTCADVHTFASFNWKATVLVAAAIWKNYLTWYIGSISCHAMRHRTCFRDMHVSIHTIMHPTPKLLTSSLEPGYWVNTNDHAKRHIFRAVPYRRAARSTRQCYGLSIMLTCYKNAIHHPCFELISRILLKLYVLANFNVQLPRSPKWWLLWRRRTGCHWRLWVKGASTQSSYFNKHTCLSNLVYQPRVVATTE